ncbi:MAG: FAD-dependent oxidoreductase [Candidatus Obscuribacterales bacterium]|nr:FAD-dependent oxidoreductase [Candidatus Obscuribacterales bacterium]
MAGIEVIIVGAGLAGLNCALHLRKQNVPFVLLDAADAVGGRIRTDELDGFKLDRGFQVLLTAYPEAKRALDYKKLNLKPYIAGALVRHNGRFHKVSDPWRDPGNMLGTMSAPIGSASDKLCLAKLQLELAYLMISNDEAARQSTMDLLKRHGFSGSMIERFFRPFFGGVFLENKLETNGKNFEFLFRMFASGDTAVPENGMEEIPRQLAEQVGMDNIRLNSKVRAIAADTVWLESGERFEAPHVVIATDVAAMRNLTDNSTSSYPPKENAERIIHGKPTFLPADSKATAVIVQQNAVPRAAINPICDSNIDIHSILSSFSLTN